GTPASKNRVRLNGSVYYDNELVEGLLASYRTDRQGGYIGLRLRKPPLGAAKVNCRLSAAGRRHLRGRPTNLGYGGNITASVWDGERWRGFSLSFLPEELRRYEFSKERPAKEAAVFKILKELRGRYARIGKRAYELEDLA